MTNREVCKRFVSGSECANGSNLYVSGDRLFSYGTCIAERLKDGFIVNATKYSVTTSKHQTYLRYEMGSRKREEVTGVPMGTRSLAVYLKMVNS